MNQFSDEDRRLAEDALNAWTAYNRHADLSTSFKQAVLETVIKKKNEEFLKFACWCAEPTEERDFYETNGTTFDSVQEAYEYWKNNIDK